MIINTRFNVGDCVWILEGGIPAQYIVDGFKIIKTHDKNITIYYRIAGVYIMDNKCFETLDKLSDNITGKCCIL